ncbi:hypothetical protein ACFLWZ_02955 [Chloroflexota bacterium]
MKRGMNLACITMALSLLFVMATSSTVLAADGKLFMVNGDTNQIVELNPDTGAELNKFSTPEASSKGPDGLAYGSGRMFFTAGHEENNGAQLIYELNPENGGVINSFPAPGDEVDALGFSCDKLFALDYDGPETIYVLDPDTGQTVATFDHDPFLVGGGTFAGTRNSVFFTGDLSGTDPSPDSMVIYELDPEDGTVLNDFEIPFEAYGLGFSSSRNTLFIGESGFTSIYEVDPDDGNVIHSFTVEAMITALAADECGDELEWEPHQIAVGGDVFPVDKSIVVAPWIALGATIIAGGVFLIRRRAHR